jgi:hypothetical protein
MLSRERYRVEGGKKIELTPAVVTRRMTNVSPYLSGKASRKELLAPALGVRLCDGGPMMKA